MEEHEGQTWTVGGVSVSDGDVAQKLAQATTDEMREVVSALRRDPDLDPNQLVDQTVTEKEPEA